MKTPFYNPTGSVYLDSYRNHVHAFASGTNARKNINGNKIFSNQSATITRLSNKSFFWADSSLCIFMYESWFDPVDRERNWSRKWRKSYQVMTKQQQQQQRQQLQRDPEWSLRNSCSNLNERRDNRITLRDPWTSTDYKVFSLFSLYRSQLTCITLHFFFTVSTNYGIQRRQKTYITFRYYSSHNTVLKHL